VATTILLIRSSERRLFDRQTKRKRENEKRKEKRLVSVESFFSVHNNVYVCVSNARHIQSNRKDDEYEIKKNREEEDADYFCYPVRESKKRRIEFLEPRVGVKRLSKGSNKVSKRKKITNDISVIFFVQKQKIMEIKNRISLKIIENYYRLDMVDIYVNLNLFFINFSFKFS
jgi:hypothetical protein